MDERKRGGGWNGEVLRNPIIPFGIMSSARSPPRYRFHCYRSLASRSDLLKIYFAHLALKLNVRPKLWMRFSKIESVKFSEVKEQSSLARKLSTHEKSVKARFSDLTHFELGVSSWWIFKHGLFQKSPHTQYFFRNLIVWSPRSQDTRVPEEWFWELRPCIIGIINSFTVDNLYYGCL
jgi:hypothetical protein